MTIALIVEGHGEVAALPILVRSIALEHGAHHVDIAPPFRLRRDKMRKREDYERALRFMAAKVAPDGPLLTVLDADDDCPATLASELLEVARSVCPDRRIGVVAAQLEYEAWLLASARSLAGRRGLPNELVPPPQPEAIRGAKEWLGSRMPRGYSPTVDQAALTASLSLEEARSAASFRKLERDVRRLLRLDLEPSAID